MTLRWKRKRITISHGHMDTLVVRWRPTIAALVHKQLAVHRNTADWFGDTHPTRLLLQPGWNVSHVPTGWALFCGLRTQAQAKRALLEVLEVSPDWNFTDPTTSKKWSKATIAKLRAIGQKFPRMSGK